MTVYTPPAYPPVGLVPSVFLGGSIEMGRATDWQEQAIDMLSPHFKAIYNPRRADWDSSWVQSASNPNFNGQVTWELGHIERATFSLFHFEAGTMSPITLLELGLAAQSKEPGRVFVSCPEGFWRRGNVEIVAERYGLHFGDDLLDTLTALIAAKTAEFPDA